ncbi:MAG: hypothetical protein JWO63_1820 [Frankiales bacterium]|jgi:hypothetical protein|nr:hypothetical protein [Frankiales bacterium]
MQPDIEQDRQDVLDAHAKWWRANVGLDIPAMRECFPSGMNFSMFNRNGFTYFGIEELTSLWQHFIDVGIPSRLTQTVNVVRLDVRGDTAWLCAELTYRRGRSEVNQDWEEGAEDLFGSKSTEIYYRDTGDGTPQWRMWHFHSSALQPWDEPRPGFEDTLTQRGLGGNPYGLSISNTTDLNPA